MKNIPPTKKEQMIMRVLVKRFSKQQLFQELVDIQSAGLISKMVQTSAKLVGIDVPQRIDSQYLNYSIENYDKINNNEFPEKFERMMTLEANITTREIRRVSAEYTITFPVLRSFSDELKQDIDENVWDYDPEFQDDETYDSETIGVELDFEKITTSWNDNVIE